MRDMNVCKMAARVTFGGRIPELTGNMVLLRHPGRITHLLMVMVILCAIYIPDGLTVMLTLYI